MGEDYVTLDFETTTYNKGNPVVGGNRLVLASWRERGRTHSRRGSEYEMAEMVAAIKRASFIVAHNAKFELGWLRRCGVDLRELVVYDTQIGEYVRGGNRYHLNNLGLNVVAPRYKLPHKYDVVGKMWDHDIETEDVPESWLQEYCERDVWLTEQIFLQQREILKERNLLPVQYSRCLLTPVLADIESKGLQLDEEYIEKLTEEMEDEYARITADLQDLGGGVPPSSISQKRDLLFNRMGFRPALDYRGKPILTPSGDPSVAADAMARLRPTNKKQRVYLDRHTEWANYHSDVTKYLRKFRECCREDNGQLYAAFNQCNTRTHRLSSTGISYSVQFQNLNRRFKPLFRARQDGWFIGEADGAQLEFRVAAHLGRDSVALADIYNGTDIHSYTAKIIGCSRQDAKAHTFKPLYGGRSGTPAQVKYYDRFVQKYQGVSGTQRGWTHTVLRTGELTTEWGLTYYWPGTKMLADGYITNTNSIYNYPVQAMATAEIIPLAMVCAWHRMKCTQSFLVNTVHDSIIAEVHPEEVELWHKVAQQCLIVDAYSMMEKLYGVALTVPLGAGVMIGTHWGSKDETKYEAPVELWIDAARKENMIDEDLDRKIREEV
jgi:DNA polymerase I-like protein with 3'-5' exonuclease and polymerase domains